jgi:hypothetical protein
MRRPQTSTDTHPAWSWTVETFELVRAEMPVRRFLFDWSEHWTMDVVFKSEDGDFFVDTMTIKPAHGDTYGTDARLHMAMLMDALGLRAFSPAAINSFAGKKVQIEFQGDLHDGECCHTYLPPEKVLSAQYKKHVHNHDWSLEVTPPEVLRALENMWEHPNGKPQFPSRVQIELSKGNAPIGKDHQ